MAGQVYYIPGDGDREADLVAKLAQGRVELEVGGAAGAPPDTAALVVGPSADPSPAFSRVKALRFVQMTTCDNLYVDALELDRRGVRVASVSPAVSGHAASHAVGLALAACSGDEVTGASVDQFKAISEDESSVQALSGMQVGIIGLGTLGIAVARRLGGSGARLVYSDLRTASRQATEGLGIRRATMDLLLTQSDVIVVTTRWGPTANPLLGQRELRLPDAGAVLVNASDSRVIDESALHDVLSSGLLKGFASAAPVSERLGGLPNVVASPLELKASESEAAAELVVSNLERFFNDEPVDGLVEPIDYPPAGDPAFWSSRLYPNRA